MNAQEYTMCATPDVENPEPFVPPSDPNFIANSEPIVYNMSFQVIYPETFVSEYEVTEDDALEVIANMNREFNKFNLFFKYRGVNIINSDEFYFVERETNDNPLDGCSLNELNSDYDLYDYVDEPGNFIENSLNTFIFYDSCGFSGLYLGDGKVGVRWPRFKEWHTIHEMGHMFGLSHSHSGYKYEPEDVSIENVTDCERVTRDETNMYFNAYMRGDGYKDTAAMPKFGSNTNNQNNSVNTNCEYSGTGKDCGGDDYQIFPDSSGTLNFMNNGTECPVNALGNEEGFTAEQGIKIYTTAMNTSTTGISNAVTSMESLYEPYKGEYYNAGGVPAGFVYPHFQPGFDYHFVRCSGYYPQPAPYNEQFSFNSADKLLSVDKYDHFYHSIVHPNHSAIRILQVDSSSEHKQVQKCYNNFNWSPKSGNVMRFNDGYFNQNITLTQKDSIGINDPALIETLPAGLYQIQKEYEGGATEQVIIQKGDN